ncbi:glycoside hydrolase superfamily [Tribonema minus]|uniref:Glycoside hydrolase superfamily n=1 Tax=Tribonema minus TaxID=303371 RepID=A0A835YK97_9STRA|nr:glycoside hydrolase superfamily [Tribonema minus]
MQQRSAKARSLSCASLCVPLCLRLQEAYQEALPEAHSEANQEAHKEAHAKAHKEAHQEANQEALPQTDQASDQASATLRQKPTKRHTKKHTKKHTRKPTKRPTKKPTKKRTDTTGPKRPGGKPLQIGVAAHMGLNQFEDDYRSNIDAWVKFTDVNEDMQWDTYIQPVLDQGKEVVLVTQFYPTDGSFDNLNAIAYYGQYDDRINSLADTLLAKGNPSNVWLRPLHEMNGDWYPWGVFSGGNNADAFKNAYRHIHDILKGRGVNAKFQLAYNCRTPDQFSYTSFGDLYPGSDYVDMIVCSGYNRAGTPNNNSWVTLKDFFSGAYDDMAGLSDTVPIGIGETGSTNYYGGNSRADWIRDAFHDIFYDFPRVEQVDWFFIDKSPESGDWELNTSEEIDAFSDGCRDYSS